MQVGQSYFYINNVGNVGAIIYTLIYYYALDGESKFLSYLHNIINILPCIIADILLYFIYVPRNKSLLIDFKGDFIKNLFTKPLLNVYIISAYIESVNFYSHVENRKVHYLKSYGKYSNKIDQLSIKDYMTLVYGVCFVCFMIFFII